MQLSEKDLDEFIEIFKKYYPNKEISRDEALEQAHSLLDLMKILIEVNHGEKI